VLDHHDRIGAARHHSAGRDCDRLSGVHDRRRHDAGVNHFVVEPKNAGKFFRCPERVLGDDGVAVDVRSIEGGNVDRREHVVGKHATERRIERDLLDPARRQIEGGVKPTLGFIAVEDLQELLLLTHGKWGRESFFEDTSVRLKPDTT
jgi:hypothetical protein